MLSISSNRIVRAFIELALLALLAFVVVGALASWAGAQTVGQGLQKQVTVEDMTPTPTTREYRGVRIGMTQDEARAKLGAAADKSDAQDYYIFSDQEMAQVFYDADHKVKAISVTYTGTPSPTAQAVLGTPITPGGDGTAYKMVRYPKAGYWVSYCRTAGDTPIVTIVMQRY